MYIRVCKIQGKIMSKIISPKIYELFERVVEDCIENYSIVNEDPNKKGEGFIGDLRFITLKHQKDGSEFNFVIKQAFADEKTRSAHPIRLYFLNEIYSYENIWTSFKKFQTEKLRTIFFDKTPKCYATSSEDRSEVIILENLKHQNFQLVDKTKPLDDKHFEFIFREYGKFHAISFAYKQLDPNGYSGILKGVQNLFLLVSQRRSFRNYLTFIFELSLKSLDHVEDVKVIEKFRDYVENGPDIFGNASVYKGNYSVISHGDCWSNNMMFKYNGAGVPSDITLLDFQFMHEGSPVSDLSYCLYTSGSKDKFEHYLKMYHDTLTQTLQEVGCDSNVYSLEELKKEWKQYAKIGFCAGLLIWRSKLIEESDARNISEVGEGEGKGDLFINTKFDKETFRRMTKDIILHMYENDCL